MDHSDFLSKNAAIALALGARVVKVSDDDGYKSCNQSYYSTIALADGTALGLGYNGWRKADRLSVDVSWPRYADGQACYFDHVRDKYGDVAPSITVSLAKSADKIAADIKRRFVPIASALYAKAVARVYSADDHAAKVAANYAKIAAAGGGSYSVHSGRHYLGGMPGGFDVSYVGADNATVKLDLSIDDLCAMLKAAVAKAAA